MTIPTMKTTLKFIFLLILYHSLISPVSAEEQCLSCHTENSRLSRFHDPAEISCTSCHAGNVNAKTKETAHQNLEAYHGRMQTVEQSCGQSDCHAELIPLVQNSRMNTLDGMLSGTRRVFGENPKKQSHPDLSQRLNDKGADSYLRKLCVSCHLGSERKTHQQNLQDRGGGCAACHLQTHPDFITSSSFRTC